MKTIPLTQNKVALVSDIDFPMLCQSIWHASEVKKGLFYAKSSKGIFMHRLVINAPKGVMVDHVNGDGLDNQRENLRLCTNAENLRNRKLHKNSTSGYKGVFPFRDKYIVQIQFDGQRFYLGIYSDPIEAAKVYDKKAIELFGDFANLNFP